MRPVAGAGFLYAATGAPWIREAMASVARLRSVHPDIPAVLFTNMPSVAAGAAFDEVIPVPDRSWVATEVKLWAVRRSPFERTVFLDTDTDVVADVSDLFAVLDRFDIAAAPTPFGRLQPNHPSDVGIPDAFPPASGGVLAFRDSPATAALFDAWWRLYQQDKERLGRAADQPSLRAALWQSECRFLSLPAEFNMRTPRYRAHPTVAVGPVRVIHGRARRVDALARRWNADHGPRLLTPLLQYNVRRALRPLARSRVLRRVHRAAHPVRRLLAGE